MTGLKYFLTKGLNPVTVEGRHMKMWLFKPLQINPYPTAFPYGNGMVLHFYQ
jgi:hypothetical protein